MLFWLETNAFWNIDCLELDISPTTSGIGVFYVPPEEQTNDDSDNLLLRIPKSNILSPKNSVIWNLLVDYQNNDSLLTNLDVDLTVGLHSIVLTFIYEVAQGKKSPWFHYLQSIVPNDENLVTINNTPLCLWPSEYKKMLHNTEYYYLDMLKSKELVDFYIECVKFASHNEKLIAKPSVFDVSSTDELDIMRDESEKVTMFGNYVQVVISRAFEVDNYHGLSLVPGADLFNHATPAVNGDGRIEGREDVHFVCDGGDEVCEVCGEFDCEDHEEELDIDFGEEGDDEEEEEQDDEEEQGSDEDDVEEQEFDDINEFDEQEGINKGEEEVDIDEDGFESDDNMDSGNELLQDSGISEEELYSTSDDDLNDSLIDESEVRSDLSDGSDDEESSSSTEEITSIKEITMDFIQDLEQELEDDSEMAESGMETDQEEEEEKEEEIEEDSYFINREELAKELADGSKCCDIVLSKRPKQDIGKYELFNTYGNHLANPFLLQRYGFITQDQNINDVVTLGYELLQYIKKYKAEQSPVKIKQLENKLSWYDEMGFEFVNDLICEYESRPALDLDNDDCEDDCEDDCCNEEEYDEHTQIMKDNLPESYRTSCRINVNGKMLPQTYALAKLLVLPYKIFHYKFIECASERKLAKRIFQILLPYEYENIKNHKPKYSDKYGAKINELVKQWCSQRLARYPVVKNDRKGDIKLAIVHQVVQEEKDILKKAIASL